MTTRPPVSSRHEVSEGDDIAFTVKRIGNTDDALTVSLILTYSIKPGYSEDLLAHISISDAMPVTVTSPAGVAPVYVNVTFPAEEATVDVIVPTDADEVDELDIIIVVIINDDDSSDYWAHSARDEIEFIVRDLPNVTITPAATPVAESASAVFNLARTSDTGVMQVQVDMTEVGAFLTSPGRTTVTFASEDLATPLTVSLDDDDLDEVDGTVTATVAAGSGYRLGNPASATVTVTDDDLQQVVSLEAESATVTEGNDIVFTLRRYTVLGLQSYEDNTRGSLTVNAQVTPEGPSLSGASPVTTATFDAGATTITLRFPTSVTATAVNGSVTATIAAGTGYTVSDPVSVTVVVTDEGQAVSIAPREATVTEGEDAVFTLTRTGSTANPLRVIVGLGGHTKIATSETEGRMGTTFWVEFGAGKASTDLTLTTHDDEINEGDGEIYAELKGYTTYNISGNARTEVLIKDDDIPVISMEQSEIDMIEGNPLVWTFIRTGDTSPSPGLFFNIGSSRTFNHPTIDFNISYNLGFYFFGPGRSKRLFTVDNGGKIYVGPAGGEAFIEVLPYHCENEPCFNPRYTVGEPSSTTYRVANRFPTINVSAAAESVEEGDPAVFTLERVWNPENLAGETTVVTFQVTQAGGVISGTPPTTVTFAAAESHKTLSVPTLENAIADDGGSVTVQLDGVDDLGAGTVEATYVIQDYEVDGVNHSRATVAVTDDDGGNSALSLTRSAPAYFQSEGQALSLTYTVENTGTVATGAPIVVHDTKLGQITCSATALAANGNVTCTGSYTVTAADVTAQEIVSTAYAAIGQKESNRVVATVALQSSSVTLSVSPDEVGEGADATDLTVTATLDAKPFTADTTVTLSVSAVTATVTDDYSATTVTLTIPAEKTSGTATLTLTPVDDAVDEVDETVTVEGTVSGLTVTGATITIIDDDLSALSIADASASEAYDYEIGFTVTLTGRRSEEVAVDYATADGTATAGADYVAKSGTLTFGTEDTEKIIRVDLRNDQMDEADETFTVTLSNAQNADLKTAQATGTIEDDDERGVTVNPTSLTVDEGSSKPYTVALTSEPTADVTVTVSVPTGTDVSVDTDSNEQGDQNTLTFTADNWNTAQTVTVSAAEDADAVVDATVTVGHAANGGDYVNESAELEVMITETDTPTLSIADGSAAENAGSMTFTVTLSTASSNAVTVTYATSNGTATAGDDYTTANGTVTFPANSTSQAITVTIANDDIDEADETFVVTLSNAVNATLAGEGNTLEATGTITDDDERGVTVSPTSLTVDEGSSKPYTVVLKSEPTGAVTVAMAKASGSDADVTVSPTDLTFTADNWSTEQTVTVSAAQDADAAADMATVQHTVSGGDYGANSVTAQTVAVTVNDDETVSTGLTLSVSPGSVGEAAGATTVTVTATLNAGARTVATAVSVSVGKTGDSATSGTDYTSVNDFTVTIVAEQTSGTGTFTLTPTDDGIAEGNETVSVTGSVTGLTVTDTELTITDNDMASTGVTLSVSPSSVGEGAGATTVTVTASLDGSARTVATTVSVSVGKTGDSATSGTDYTSVNDFTVTIASEQTSGTGTFTLTPVSDDVDENNETVSVGGTVTELTVTADEVTITDDDTRGVTVSPTSLTVDEGSSKPYTVVLKSEPTGAVTVAVAKASGSDADVTVSPTDLTFTADNWSTEQTVTVSAAQDADAAADMATVEHTVSGGDYGANSVTAQTVAVTVNDDETVSTGLTLSVSPGSVGEAAGAVTVTVTATLNAGARTVATTVTVSIGDASDSATSGTDYTSVNDFTVTIASEQTSGTGMFTLTPVSDDVDENNETVSVDGTVTGLTVTSAEVTITDDDERGVTVDPTSLTVNEGGDDTYTVVLKSKPTADVTVTVNVPDRDGRIGGYGLKRARQPEHLDVYSG